jgi:hypothetical protein
MTLYSNFIEKSRKNVLFNGNFDMWPVGTSFPVGKQGDTAGMVVFGDVGTGVFAVTASNASKPNDNCNQVYKIETTTAKTSFTGSEYAHTFFKVEGYDFVPFIGKTATLSFWVRSSVPGTYSVFFRSEGADASYIQEFTINTADTWEYKIITLTFDYSIGTWNYTNGIGLSVGFSPALGTTYATSTFGQWISGNYIGSTNQVNFAATIGNTFQISQMQLELGNTATPFDRISFAEIQENMDRYYQAISLSHLNATSVTTGAGNCYCSWDFPTIMRAVPTVNDTGAQFWSGHLSWAAATAVQHSANSVRCLTTMQNANDTGYAAGWALLMGITVYLDARL